jgi:hypothetical protein
MIEQLKAYLSNESCDLENDTVSSILLDEDRIQIYFSVDEEYDVVITGIELYDEEGNEIDFTDNEYLESGELIQDWVKPSDNTIVIEGRIYN